MIVGGLLEGLGHRLTGRGTADNGEAAVGCFALELGTQHGDTSIPVSWPSINILFSHIFSYPLVIFSTRYFRHNSGHQLTFPGFKHSLCALNQRRFGLSPILTLKDLNLHLRLCFLFVSPPVSLSNPIHQSAVIFLIGSVYT
jgi:hypothetical protein